MPYLFTAGIVLSLFPWALGDCPPPDLLGSYLPGELAFTSFAEQANQHHLTCKAVGDSSSIVQKVVVEFQRGQVGIRTDIAGSSASYPCGDEYQDSWGQMNIEVIELNGINIYDAGAASITTSEPLCSVGGDRFFYNGSVQVTQVASEHLAINAYMFRNPAEQSAANLQHTMTIGVMDKCKVELIYSFKPKPGGGLDARIGVTAHAFGGLEPSVNAAMFSEINSEDNKLSIFIPKSKLLEGAGLGPDGCGSTFDNVSSEMHHIVDVSLSFVCAATGQIINDGTFEWQGNSLTVSLTSSQAPESCDVLYWDPLVTPINPEADGEIRPTAAPTAASTAAPTAAPTADNEADGGARSMIGVGAIASGAFLMVFGW